MKKENLAFLVGGFAFGVLVGVGLFSRVQFRLQAARRPVAGPASVPAPAGPTAPTQAGGGCRSDGAARSTRSSGVCRRTLTTCQSPIRLANLFHDAQMWDQAVMYYEKAVELTPNDPDLLTDLGSATAG